MGWIVSESPTTEKITKTNHCTRYICLPGWLSFLINLPEGTEKSKRKKFLFLLMFLLPTSMMQTFTKIEGWERSGLSFYNKRKKVMRLINIACARRLAPTYFQERLENSFTAAVWFQARYNPKGEVISNTLLLCFIKKLGNKALTIIIFKVSGIYWRWFYAF